MSFFGIGKTNVTLYPGEPKLFINDPDGPVIRNLDLRMTRAQAVARRLVRVRTGKLLSSIRKNRGFTSRGPYVEVLAGGSGIDYVGYEHDGTPPHVIRVRFKKSLRFTVGGKVTFRKQVFHPGTKGSHFLTLALPAAGGD